MAENSPCIYIAKYNTKQDKNTIQTSIFKITLDDKGMFWKIG